MWIRIVQIEGEIAIFILRVRVQVPVILYLPVPSVVPPQGEFKECSKESGEKRQRRSGGKYIIAPSLGWYRRSCSLPVSV